LEYCADRKILGSAGFDETVRLWDPEFHTLIAELHEHTGPVYALRFTPNGKLFVTASADRTIKLWRTSNCTTPMTAVRDGQFDTDSLSLSRNADYHTRSAWSAKSPLLSTGERFVDSLLSFRGSHYQLLQTISKFVDLAFQPDQIDFGRIATQIITIRGEQARRTRDQLLARNCARLISAFQEVIHSKQASILVKYNEGGITGPPSGRHLEEAQKAGGAGGKGVGAHKEIVIGAGVEKERRELWKEIEHLSSLGESVLKGSAPASAALTASRRLSGKARQLGDSLAEAVLEGLAGQLLCVGGDNVAGITCIVRALELVRELDRPELECAIMGDLGNAYRNINRLVDASAMYKGAIAIARQRNDDYQLVKHLSNFSIVTDDQNLADETLALLTEARRLAEAHDFTMELGAVLTQFGTLYIKLQEYVSAEECYSQALVISEKLGNERHLAANLGNVALALRHQGRLDESRKHYLKSLNLAAESRDQSITATALLGLSKIADQGGDLSQAVRWAAEAVQHVRMCKFSPHLLSHLTWLGELKCRQGKLRESLVIVNEAIQFGELRRQEVARPQDDKSIQSELARLYTMAVTISDKLGQTTESFVYAERGRAVLLLKEIIKNRPELSSVNLASVFDCLHNIGPRAVLISYFFADQDLFIFVLRGGQTTVTTQCLPNVVDQLKEIAADFEREVKVAKSLLGGLGCALVRYYLHLSSIY
jgi:tetratricopeptide (TPR) repeat protein